MVALKSRDIDAFLAKPDPRHADHSALRSRCRPGARARRRVDRFAPSTIPNDPFSLVRIDGDELAAEPSRLVDEAMTVPLFGGRRAIRIRAGSRNIASGVQTLSQMPPTDCRVVIEAGDLRARARRCARSAKAPKPSARDPPAMSTATREIAQPDRRGMRRPRSCSIALMRAPALIALLGADRAASRGELKKLMLYAHGKDEVTLEDVLAVVTDAIGARARHYRRQRFGGKARRGRGGVRQGAERRRQSGRDHLGRAAPGGAASPVRGWHGRWTSARWMRWRRDFRGCTFSRTRAGRDGAAQLDEREAFCAIEQLAMPRLNRAGNLRWRRRATQRTLLAVGERGTGARLVPGLARIP